MTRFGRNGNIWTCCAKLDWSKTNESVGKRMNSLNAVPIRQIYERWVSPFRELWSSQLLMLKEAVEEKDLDKKGIRSVKRKKI